MYQKTEYFHIRNGQTRMKLCWFKKLKSGVDKSDLYSVLKILFKWIPHDLVDSKITFFIQCSVCLQWFVRQNKLNQFTAGVSLKFGTESSMNEVPCSALWWMLNSLNKNIKVSDAHIRFLKQFGEEILSFELQSMFFCQTATWCTLVLKLCHLTSVQLHIRGLCGSTWFLVTENRSRIWVGPVPYESSLERVYIGLGLTVSGPFLDVICSWSVCLSSLLVSVLVYITEFLKPVSWCVPAWIC